MSTEDIWLIVGLGNPGPKYAESWHNCGWMALDHLAEHERIAVNRIKFKGLYGRGTIKGQKVILLKPTTFMNNSGESVRAAMDYFRVARENVLLLYDDLDVAKGLVRIREKGGAGTHNGMRSVVRHLGGTDFPRIRIGIGPLPPNWDIIDYVLSSITADERPLMEEAMRHCCEAIVFAMEKDIQFAMNRINRRKLNQKEDR